LLRSQSRRKEYEVINLIDIACFHLYVYCSSSQDSNLHRPARLEPLKLRLLKSTAAPSVFPNLPSHLSKVAPKERSETATSSSRQQRAACAHEEEVSQFLDADKVSSLEALQEKLDLQCFPKGVDMWSTRRTVIFMIVTLVDGCPTLSASLVIQEFTQFML
jgi:hypothetical protein